jgi:hypothetical protein
MLITINQLLCAYLLQHWNRRRVVPMLDVISITPGSTQAVLAAPGSVLQAEKYTQHERGQENPGFHR